MNWSSISLVQFYSPVLDQRNIDGTPGAARAEVEWSWRPQQSDAIGCVVCVQRSLLEEGFHVFRKLKLLIIIRQRLLTLNWGIKEIRISVK